MPNLAEALGAARQCRQTGDFAGAEHLLRRIVAEHPNDPEALQLLGSTCQDRGNLKEAIGYLRKAIQLRPNLAAAHNDLGIALSLSGKPEEARASFTQALRHQPGYAEAHNNLGSVLREMGRYSEAVEHFRETVRLRPQFAEGHDNLGIALLQAGKPDEAFISFQEAVRLKPDFAVALKNLGIALNNRGQPEEGIQRLQQALQLRPDLVEARLSLALAYYKLGKLDEGIEHSLRALQFKPDFAEGHNNLGSMLLAKGQIPEALARFQLAERLKPEFAEAHWNRALLLLLLGRFEEGWLEYEWRRKIRNMRVPRQPFWDGSPLGGRRILLLPEQGLGDIIQAVRYAPLVRERGGVVIVGCPTAMRPILSRCPGIDLLISDGAALPEFDLHAPLMSLPGIFDTALETIPAAIPYVFPDPQLVDSWGSELARCAGFKIGICWRGDPKYPGDRFRSMPLKHFAVLAEVPGVRLISLQKGPGTDELAAVADQFPVIDLGPRLDATAGAFMDTAAIMKHLDLVITVDTAVAHVAGAIGVPVWLVLGLVPDWRWLLGREDSPWYPTMRLFRQNRLGDWDELFARVSQALRQKIAAPIHATGVTVEISVGELLDKLTILEIKRERLTDAEQLRHVGAELETLQKAREASVPISPRLAELVGELRKVNEALWEVEDKIRACERCGDFGARFVELARTVYRENDRRSALKRAINEAVGSRLVEEKSYTAYD